MPPFVFGDLSIIQLLCRHSGETNTYLGPNLRSWCAGGRAGNGSKSSFTISYVLPTKHTLASLPKPKPPIRLRLVEPEIIASYRFRGNSPSDATVRTASSLR